MAIIKYNTPDSSETVMTTELNSLANNANAITGTAVSNDAAGELDLYATFEFLIATQGSNRTSGRIALYILPEIDGNFTYGSASLDPPSTALAGFFEVDTGVTTSRYTHLREVKLPPTDFHIVIINETGVAFAASGNTLKMERYNIQSN